MRLIRARLEGPEARLGQVAAADVARLILGLERALARAAYVVLRRQRPRTGRHIQPVEQAVQLRMVGVEPGSVVELLALPDAPPAGEEQLPIDSPDLSALALEQLLDAISSDGSGLDAELASAVEQLAAELGIGDRNNAITLTGTPSRPGASAREATIDIVVKERMERAAGVAPLRRDDTLVGTLVEADFEGHSARLRLPDGAKVAVQFPPDLADRIQEALRARTRVAGLVRYDRRTRLAMSLELRTLAPDRGLLDADAFWQPVSFAQLQAAQGTAGRVNPDDLELDLEEEERAAFLAGVEA